MEIFLIQLFRNIGKNVQRLRETKNLTQSEFAEHCQLSRSQILRAESGRGEVRLTTLATIAHKNKVSLQDLLNERSLSVQFLPIDSQSSDVPWVKENFYLSPLQTHELELKKSNFFLAICLKGKIQLRADFQNHELLESDGCFVKGVGKIQLLNLADFPSEILILRKTYSAI